MTTTDGFHRGRQFTQLELLVRYQRVRHCQWCHASESEWRGIFVAYFMWMPFNCNRMCRQAKRPRRLGIELMAPKTPCTLYFRAALLAPIWSYSCIPCTTGPSLSENTFSRLPFLSHDFFSAASCLLLPELPLHYTYCSRSSMFMASTK